MAPKVDPDDLIDSTQVADVLGLSRFNAVSTYRTRNEDFPIPVIERGRCVLWLRADIVAWRVKHPARAMSSAAE